MATPESRQLFFENNTIKRRTVFESERLDEIQNLLKDEPNAVLISTSGKILDAHKIESIFSQYPVFHLEARHANEIQLAYADSKTLGKDRLASLIAASKLWPEKNICIVDAGTCLTLDFLQSGSLHLGGTISPGLKMRFKAMKEFTANLPLSTENELVGEIGKSTSSCLASGVVFGIVSEIEFHFSRFLNKCSGNAILILTGGDADFFAQRLNPSNFVAPDLVFQGMNFVLNSLISTENQ